MPLNIVQVQNGQIALVDADGTPVGTAGNPLRSDPTGDTAQPITATSLPLPSGAAQEHVTAVSPMAVRLTDGSAFFKPTTPSDTQPISASSLPLPAGAATETTLAAIKNTDGIKKIVDALPTGTNTIGKVDQGAAGSTAWKTDGSGVTQPVSATSLPLPTGAATETTLAAIKNTDGVKKIVDPLPTGTNTLGKIDQGAAGASAWKVDGSSVTQPISATSLPLPTGAATETTLLAIKNTDGVKKIVDALPTGDNRIGRVKVTDDTNVLGVDAQNHAYVSGKAAPGAVPASNPVSVSGIDGSGLKRTLRTDMMGRLQFVPAAVATALPNMADLFWRASDAAIVANQFKRVLTYTVPAGYSGYLIRFTTWQAEVAYSRLVAETNFGSLNVVTNVWTSTGSVYAAPQFSGTVEAEVTTQFGSANNVTVTVGYTNQSGTAGRSTSFSVPKSSIVGTRIVVPLQSGDLGIRSVQTVSASPSGGAGVLKLLGFIQLAWHHDVSTTFGADTPYQQGAIAFPENTVLGLEYAGLGVSKDRILEALIQLVPNV